MISVCCCSINARYDVELLVRSLHRHNPDVDFEVVVTHDDRVNDGSGEYFKKLQEEFPKFKVVRFSFDDSVRYLDRLFEGYERGCNYDGTPGRDLLDKLKHNLDLYKKGWLFDTNQSFLWLSSGILYNKAIEASSGDIILVHPGDFHHLFSLKRLEDYVRTWSSTGGYFYSSPHAVFTRTTNQDQDWLIQHVNNVHNGIDNRPGWRWDSQMCFKDYLRCPTTLAETFIPDFYRNELVSFDRDDFTSRMAQLLQDQVRPGHIQNLQSFHGFHVMTRTTYKSIGGFNEGFFGRAVADDMMTYQGVRSPAARTLPIEFSLSWCGQYELLPTYGAGYPQGWETILAQKDPLHDKHPIPGAHGPTYLNKDVVSNAELVSAFDIALNRRPYRVV